MNINYPSYSYRERLADGCVHAVGTAAAISGVIVILLIAIGDLPPLTIVCLATYCLALIAAFAVSAAYHLTWISPLKTLLGRFDRATIYVKIASTYTPFALVKLSGLAGIGLFSVVWTAAIVGLTLKLFFPDRLIAFSYALYLVQGWAALLVIDPMVGALSWLSLILLVAGGILYTVGVAFHLWHRLRYHQAIWHGFVLAGASCHFVAIVDSVVLG